MNTTQPPENPEPGPLLGLGSSGGLGPCSKCGFALHGSSGGMRHYGTHTAHQESECLQLLHAEISRLTAALKTANEQTERFKRGWYLRGDALDKLDQWARAYPLKVFPEPLREEWQRAAALLSEKGLSLDRMSASNVRHVISGVRETVAEGLRA